MDLSIVIPAYNEQESIPELLEWIKRSVASVVDGYEVIFIDDGSNDDTWSVICASKQTHPEVKGLRLQRNSGKSAALRAGFKEAQGDIVVTMDADLQDSPEEIPEMMRMIHEDNLDVVSGWKKKRYDPITKTVPTKIYNWATRQMSGIHLHDFNCGLKAYRRPVVKSVDVRGEMHRYIPVLAKWSGYRRIGEKVVQHQERKYGSTKFGMERFMNGFLDLLTVTFVTRFSKSPMHLFGLWGSFWFLIGFGIFAFIAGEKVYNMSQGIVSKNIAEMSQFYIALVVMIIGTQLFLAGFLGELIIRNSNKDDFRIAERV
ncbi:MAG: glycosyltransferase family 2 protein [Flavobacteriales bacterium]|nr:glycosyltransferase family 2 protein [Flavobacteriales bacterium]